MDPIAFYEGDEPVEPRTLLGNRYWHRQKISAKRWEREQVRPPRRTAEQQRLDALCIGLRKRMGRSQS